MALAIKPNVRNLVTNGNFANGATGWGAIFANILLTEKNILQFIASGANGRAKQGNTNEQLVGHKIYRSGLIKATSNLVGIGEGSASSKSHSGNGMFERLSYISTWASFSIAIAVVDTRTSGWDTIYVSNLIAIDLTATFGAGKEPNLATCDALFAEWFDGGKYFPELAAPKRTPKTVKRQNNAVKVPGGKNLLNLYDELYKLDPRTLTRIVKDGRQCISIGNPSYYNAKSILTGRFKPNTQYTLKFDIAVNMTLNAMSGLICVLNYTDGTKLNCYYTPNTDESLKTISFTTQAGKSVQSLSFTFAYNKDTYVDENTIQLEEGAVATPYEPYRSVNRPALR